MDGTLADTEGLKAATYQHLVQKLLKADAPDPRVLTLYPTLVGGTDEQMVRALVDLFGLAGPLKPYAHKYGVQEAWLALHLLRFDTYRATFATAEKLSQNSYPGTVQLVRDQAAAGRKVAVATSSPTDEAIRVVTALNLAGILSEVVGLDQVKRHKPDPEIYLLTASRIGVDPAHTVAIEDSPTGIRAALAAGMSCIAIANPFTEKPLREQKFLEQRWVVYNHATLNRVVQERLSSLEQA